MVIKTELNLYAFSDSPPLAPVQSQIIPSYPIYKVIVMRDHDSLSTARIYLLPPELQSRRRPPSQRNLALAVQPAPPVTVQG